MLAQDSADIGDIVASSGFSSKGLNPEKNIRVWKDAVSTLFEVDEFAPDDGESFHADLSTYALGPVLLAVARASGQRFRRSLMTIATSGVDHLLVQLYIRGGYKGVAGSRPISVQTGDVCILDLSCTVETRATTFETLTLVVPRPKLASRIKEPDALHGLVIPRESAIAGVIGRHLQTLAELASRMRLADCGAIADGSIDLLAACLRVELEKRDPNLAGGSVDLVIRVRQHIDTSLDDPHLSVEQLAHRFGLSRASLYRLFVNHGGIASYIKSRRLQRAFFDLANPELSIKDIIRRWRFSSAATFSRAFMSAYGISPTMARHASRKPRPGCLAHDMGRTPSYRIGRR